MTPEQKIAAEAEKLYPNTRTNGNDIYHNNDMADAKQAAYIAGATSSSTVKELQKKIDEYEKEVKMFDDLEDPSVGDFITFIKRIKQLNSK